MSTSSTTNSVGRERNRDRSQERVRDARSSISSSPTRVSFPKFQAARTTSSKQPPTIRKEWTSSLYRSEGMTHGIPVDREEVEAAFRFFDVDNKGVLTPKDLRERLSIFYDKLTPQEYRFLIPEKDFTVDKLYNLLANNDLTNFDPVREAYKLFDPTDCGHVDVAVLRKYMRALGYGELTDEDIETLIHTGDVDGDGVISPDDFRRMIDFNKNRSEEETVDEWGIPISRQKGFGDRSPSG